MNAGIVRTGDGPRVRARGVAKSEEGGGPEGESPHFLDLVVVVVLRGVKRCRAAQRAEPGGNVVRVRGRRRAVGRVQRCECVNVAAVGVDHHVAVVAVRPHHVGKYDSAARRQIGLPLCGEQQPPVFRDGRLAGQLQQASAVVHDLNEIVALGQVEAVSRLARPILSLHRHSVRLEPQRDVDESGKRLAHDGGGVHSFGIDQHGREAVVHVSDGFAHRPAAQSGGAVFVEPHALLEQVHGRVEVG